MSKNQKDEVRKEETANPIMAMKDRIVTVLDKTRTIFNEDKIEEELAQECEALATELRGLEENASAGDDTKAAKAA